MKFAVSFLLALTFCMAPLRADSVQLHNGVQYVGKYIGGTETEIWFQPIGVSPAPARAIPTASIQSLTFGPVPVTPTQEAPPSVPTAPAVFRGAAFRDARPHADSVCAAWSGTLIALAR